MNNLSKEQIKSIQETLYQLYSGETDKQHEQLIQLLSKNFTLYVGVDIHQDDIHFIAKNAIGEILLEPSVISNSDSQFPVFSKLVSDTCSKFNLSNILIGMEATGIYYKRFKKFSESQSNFQVFVYNPRQAYHLAKAKLEYKKTDPISAGIICDLMRIGEFPAGKTPMQPQNEALLKLVLEKFNRTTIQAEQKTHLKEDLEQVGKSLLKVFKQRLVFGKGPLTLLEQYPLPEDRINAGVNVIAQVLHQASAGDYGQLEAELIIKLDKQILSSPEPPIQQTLRTLIPLRIREIQHQQNIIENILVPQIDSLIANSPVKALLDTIKGVGKSTLPVFAAFSDIICACPSGDDFAGFCGLVPCERESGSKKGRKHISKTGPPILRWALFLVADCIRKYDQRLSALYKRVKDKHKVRGKKIAHLIANCAVAREVATLIWSVVKFQRPYFPNKEEYKKFVRSLPKEHPLIVELNNRKLIRKFKKQRGKYIIAD